jgi:hypothetical protein
MADDAEPLPSTPVCPAPSYLSLEEWVRRHKLWYAIRAAFIRYSSPEQFTEFERGIQGWLGTYLGESEPQPIGGFAYDEMPTELQVTLLKRAATLMLDGRFDSETLAEFEALFIRALGRLGVSQDAPEVAEIKSLLQREAARGRRPFAGKAALKEQLAEWIKMHGPVRDRNVIARWLGDQTGEEFSSRTLVNWANEWVRDNLGWIDPLNGHSRIR